ncbi:MAG: hypothetical protein L6R38_006249 [Xanthoria sp. 2 TBL-2021]|nr:MAG: hypothetical protein L6R38_006249 [Xanthoria sp. 2 TBL-2021]
MAVALRSLVPSVGIGIFLGIAVTLAVGRTYIRIIQTRKISVDDGFFYLAVVALIAGTTTLYFDIPYIYVPQNVDPSTFHITPAFIAFLQQSLRFQASTCALLSVALFSVKLFFLTFFHGLLRRVRGLMIFWWCVLCFMVPVAIIFVCIIFMVCPYFDERVLVKCSTPAAFARQNSLIQAAAVLDIFTDILIIIIPVALLWRVRISLRRKILLMFILGLSIFTIIVSVVRIAGANYPNGSVDSAWVTFWLQLEAAVAVIIVSITSYRSLFVKDKSTDKKSPRYHSTSYKRKLWSREKREEKRVEMPTMPDPTLTEMRTVIGRARGYDDRFSRSEDFFLPPTAKGIVVTREADVRTDGRLPNVGADYSRIPRLRRHKWSPEEKQVLYILSSNYDNPSGELWRIFNAHFKERRRCCAPSAKRATVTNGLLTPPPSAQKTRKWKSRIQTNTPVPSIAFRAFNSHSQGINGVNGFIAGLFVNSTSIPDPPTEKEYLAELRRHLEKHHSGPTPFISVSPYLMRVIIHAYRRDREKGHKTDWSVAVIALSKVSSDIKAVWELNAGFNATMAFGEWVVHGCIPASNVLCVVPLSRLVEIMSCTIPPFHIGELSVARNLSRARNAMASAINRRLTYDDGLAVGRVLLVLGTPERYIDEVTSEILRDWRFPEGAFPGQRNVAYPERRDEAWRANGGFLRGRREGFRTLMGGFCELAGAGDGLGVGMDEGIEFQASNSAYGIAFDPPRSTVANHCHDDYNATAQAPAVDHTPFWGFLQELEVAAFGTARLDGSIPCGAINGFWEGEPDLKMKEESPDCLALDSMAECLES